MKEIKKSKIQLQETELGWILLPVEGDISILDELYCGNYEQMPQAEKYFMQGSSIEEVLKHVEDVAKGMDIDLFKEPNEGIFSLTMVVLPPPLSFSVDLKWGLWYANEDELWIDEDGTPILDAMKAAFKGDGPAVTIHTAPRKEIRFGAVGISEGEANVRFHTQWDSPYCHIPDDFPDDEELRNEFEEIIADYFQNEYGYCEGDYKDPIGAEIEVTVTTETFEELMEKIEECESELIHEESEHSDRFQQFIQDISKFLLERGKVTDNSGVTE